MLKDCINDVLSRRIFSDSLKFANITPVYKKRLSYFFKDFEKAIYDQLSQFMEKIPKYYPVSGKLVPHNMVCSISRKIR